MKDKHDTRHAVSAAIFEAKHCETLGKSAIAQVMGYCQERQ